MLFGDISLWRLWLLCTSSMMCNNAQASYVRFFLNQCSCYACRNSSLNVFLYSTHTKISSGYLLSRLNTSRSIPSFHQIAYPSYSSTWITKKRMILACGILTTIDIFEFSIFARLDCVWLWFNHLATNSYHG
jgi:hypothetical protein